VLGLPVADLLMEHLPASGWGDVARRSDLDHLERVLRTDMESMRVELRGEIAELRAEMARQTRSVLVGMGSMVVSIMAALTVSVLTFGH
jgi:hypothetical protein